MNGDKQSADAVDVNDRSWSTFPVKFRLYLCLDYALGLVVLIMSLHQIGPLLSATPDLPWLVEQAGLFLILLYIGDQLYIKPEGLPTIGLGGCITFAALLTLPAPLPFLSFLLARIVGQELRPMANIFTRLSNNCLTMSIVLAGLAGNLFQSPWAALNSRQNFPATLAYIVLLVLILDLAPNVIISIEIALSTHQPFLNVLRETVSFGTAINFAMTSSGVIIAVVWRSSPWFIIFLVAPAIIFRTALLALDSSRRAELLSRFSDQLRRVLDAGSLVHFGEESSVAALRPLIEASLSLANASTASLYVKRRHDDTLELILTCHANDSDHIESPLLLSLEAWSGISQIDGVVTVLLKATDNSTVTGVVRIAGLETRILDAYQEQILGILGSQIAINLENSRLHDEVRVQATRDPLTGINNRRAFDIALAAEGERYHRTATPMCLLYIDLDHFKSINDTYGHQTGDSALQEIARAISGAVRKADCFGRLGGDEFAVLMPQTDIALAVLAAHRIHTALAGVSVTDEQGRVVSVDCSLGLAALPQHAASVGELSAQADKAAYMAKQAGRGLVCLADGTIMSTAA